MSYYLERVQRGVEHVEARLLEEQAFVAQGAVAQRRHTERLLEGTRKRLLRLEAGE